MAQDFSGRGKLTIQQESHRIETGPNPCFSRERRRCVEKWNSLQDTSTDSRVLSRSLSRGFKIVADLANGPQETTARYFLTLEPKYGNEPGRRDHQRWVGSEHPELMQELREKKADFGLAHDGDGDRVIFADSEGNRVHGDQVLGLLALDSKSGMTLKGNGLVATEHSNSGLGASLAKEHIDFFRSEVGDRNVSLLMKEKGCNLGGESSGHVVSSDYLPTGDGLFTGLRVAQAIGEQKSLRELARTITLWPSKSASFKVKEKVPVSEKPELAKFWTRPIFGSKTRGVFSSDIRARSQNQAVGGREDQELVTEVFSLLSTSIEKIL